MKLASKEFARAVQASRTAVTACDAWFSGRITYPNLPITSGTVALSADALVRGTFQGVIGSEGPGLLPIRATDPLATYGQEVNPRRGVALANGVTELLSLGYYRINTSTTKVGWMRRGGEHVASGTATTLDCEDRMATARDYRFVSPFQPSGSVKGNLRNLLAEAGMPSGSWANVTDRSVSGSPVYDKERSDALTGLAASLNAQLYVDGNGIAQLEPLPSLDTPQFTYTLDSPALLQADLVMSREDVYNGVVAKGEVAGTGQPPLLSIAVEQTGFSAWGGAFGRVPYFFSSPLLTDQGQVDSAAVTRLATLISGRDLEMNVRILPDPRMEPNDVVLLDFPVASFLGRVREVRIPIGAGGQDQQVKLRLVSNRTIVKWT